jgi:hypothetical protein
MKQTSPSSAAASSTSPFAATLPLEITLVVVSELREVPIDAPDP